MSIPCLDPCHHNEYPSQARASISQPATGGAHGHLEPDSRPLGLHSVEEGRAQETLPTAPQLLGPPVPHPPPLEVQPTPELSGHQHLSHRPGQLLLHREDSSARHSHQIHHLKLIIQSRQEPWRSRGLCRHGHVAFHEAFHHCHYQKFTLGHHSKYCYADSLLVFPSPFKYVEGQSV